MELRVSFTGPLWPVPTPGFWLSVGELTLRNPLSEATPFFFVFKRSIGSLAQGGPSVRLLNVMSLEPHEIVGRAPECRPSRLLISPFDSPVLTDAANYTIRRASGPYCARSFSGTPVTFQIFSDDAKPEAALAMFLEQETIWSLVIRR